MGEIIGWGNLHGAEEQENWSGDSTPLDSTAGSENGLLFDEETTDAVIYEAADEEDNTQCVQICASSCPDKEAISIELKPRSEISPEPPFTTRSSARAKARIEQIKYAGPFENSGL